MHKRLLTALLPLLFLAVFAQPVHAGGPSSIALEITPSGVIQAPGSQYVVKAQVFTDQSHTTVAKGWPVRFMMTPQQASDYISQSSDKTDNDGRVYAKIISNIQGSRQIQVEATAPDGTFVSSNVMALNYTGSSPIAPLFSVRWDTSYALLYADNFYINVKGKLDHIAGGVFYVKSDPMTKEDPNRTTLEVDATHDGEDSKIVFTFTYTPGQFWKVSEIKYMTTGLSPANWIYFNTTDQDGNPIQHSLGETYINMGTVEFTAKELGGTVLHMEGVRMRGFPLDYKGIPSTGIEANPTAYPSVIPTVQINPTYSATASSDELNKKVADLEKKLAASEKKQSVLEQRIEDLKALIQRLFSIFRR